ncbi:MAG: hypothetical protein IPO19_00275 [Rhodoferax sp.]|nr:hypothetical protein [Rhodoferax sp.]
MKPFDQQVALAQYLVGQLKLDVRRCLPSSSPPTRQHEPASKAASAELAVNADTHRAEREAMVSRSVHGIL